MVVFEIESIRAHLKSNAKVKETKLNESRLLNLYAIDAHWDQAKPFYLVTAQKRIVVVYLWQAISKSFKKVKLFNMPDVCQVLALWGPVLFVGLPSEFSRINIDEEEERLQGMSLPQTIFSFHVSPLDVVHLEKELLICYNSELTLLLETVFSLRSNYLFFFTSSQTNPSLWTWTESSRGTTLSSGLRSPTPLVSTAPAVAPCFWLFTPDLTLSLFSLSLSPQFTSLPLSSAL